MKLYHLLFLPVLFLTACGHDAQIVQGPPGPAASPSPYDIVGQIVPCGKEFEDDEVLLKLANGKLLASINVNGKAMLSELGAGNWVTSDRKHCAFTVRSDNSVVW